MLISFFLSFDHGNIFAKDLVLFLITNLKEIKENLGFLKMGKKEDKNV